MTGMVCGWGWGTWREWLEAFGVFAVVVALWFLPTGGESVPEQAERLARAPRGTRCARRWRWWRRNPNRARSWWREMWPMALVLSLTGCDGTSAAGGLLLGLCAGVALARGWRRLCSIWQSLREESDTDRAAAWPARHPERRTCGYEPWGSERESCGAPATCVGEWAGSDWLPSCDKHCRHHDGRCYPLGSVRPRSWWRVLRDALAASLALSLSGCTAVGWASAGGLAAGLLLGAMLGAWGGALAARRMRPGGAP